LSAKPTIQPTVEAFPEEEKHVEKFSVRNPGQLDLRVQAISSGQLGMSVM
jgi:hypothetical protein